MSTVYTIFSKSFAAEKLQQPVIVKNAFNIWALLFTIPWAMYQGLWKLAVIVMTFYLLLFFGVDYGYIPEKIQTLSCFLLAFYIACNSGYFIEIDLESRGYKLVDLIITKSTEEARGIYLQRVAMGQVVDSVSKEG